MARTNNRRQQSTFDEIKQFPSEAEIDRAIEKLRRRHTELQELWDNKVQYDDQRRRNVEQNIQTTILEIFGPNSPEYGQYRNHRIWHGPMQMGMSTNEIQAGFMDEFSQTGMMMKGLMDRLEEQRADLRLDLSARGHTAFTAGPEPANAPRAFISYSHDSAEHRRWIRDLAARLRSDGVETILDQWELAPGDHIPQFMERAVRENDFVMIVCTPRYKERSEARLGGVGYEGDIMTAQVYQHQDHRKFIPVFRSGDWSVDAPTWLAGKYHVDLRGDPYSEEEYLKLRNALHRAGEKPPPVRSVTPHENPDKPTERATIEDQTKRGRGRERGRSAGRDVLAEAITNLKRALSAEATTLQYELADGAWRLQRPDVVRLFGNDWDGLHELVDVYDSASSVSRHSREWKRFEMSSTHETEARDLLLRHAEEWFRAIEILRRKVLTPAEAAKLDAKTDDLRKRLASSQKILELDRRKC